MGAIVFWGLAVILIWRTGTEPALRKTSEDGWRAAWEWLGPLAGVHLLLLPPMITYDQLVWGGSVFISVTLVATGFRPGLLARRYFNWDSQHNPCLWRRGAIGQAVVLTTILVLGASAGLQWIAK